MADRDPVWFKGDSYLLYDPTSGIDHFWSMGDSMLMDSYSPSPGGGSISTIAGVAVGSIATIAEKDISAVSAIGGVAT